MLQSNKKYILIGLLFIFIFLFQIGIQADVNRYSIDDYVDENLFLSNGFQDLDIFNETVEECDDVCEDINYNFSADLIDSTNCSRNFTAGTFESYSHEKDDYYNESLSASQLDNQDDYIPSEDDFTIINGTMVWNNNLTDCDGVYTPFNGTEAYHFPATYSFEGDADGSNPAGWTSDESGGTINVIDYLDGHRKIVEMHDTSNVARVRLYQVFTGQTNGTAEWWIRSSDYGCRTYMLIQDGGIGAIYLYLWEDGNIKYNDGAYHNIMAYNADQWYHFRVEWDCSCCWYLWIDGVKQDVCGYNFNGDPVAVNQIYFMSRTACTDYYIHIDAIGYSWEEYQIGDNYHWQFYSSEPYDFEDDDLSTDGHYYGDPSSFTDDDCSESCEYYGGESDAFSFVGETGETGLDIEWVDAVSTAANTEIVASVDGHCEVLNQSNIGGNDNAFHHFDAHSSGTIEYWIYATDSSKRTNLYLYGDVGSSISFRINTGNFMYWDGAAWTNWACLSNTWYHIRMKWYVDHYVDVYCNGCLQVDGKEMPTNFSAGLNKIVIQTYDTVSYLDAYGESWDATYKVGDNCNPYGLPDEVSDFIDSYSVAPYTSVSVIACLDGHKKVLDLTDDSVCGYVQVYNYFSNQEYGTVEAWVRTTDATPYNLFKLYDGATEVVKLTIVADKWKYKPPGVAPWTIVPNVADPVDDTWYHIRIDFECTAGGYQGLSQYKFEFYVDCVSSGELEFANNQSHVDTFTFYTHSTSTGYSFFWDAIGYSWLTYTVSDNINPYGRPVDLSTFIDDRSITCDTSVAISGEFGIHKKFINLTDDGTGQIKIYNNFESSQTSGTVEWWWLITDNTKYAYVEFNEDATSIIYLITHTATFRYHTGGAWQDTGCPVVSDYWHHHRIDFECGSGGYMGLPTDTMDWYIDGVLEVDNGNFRSVSDVINKINIKTYTTQTGYSAYYDAFQYSWDPDCDEFWNYETSGWTLTEGATAHINIIDQLGCHYNVLNISDKGGTPDPQLYQSLTEQVTGCISFNLMIDSTFASSDTFIFELWDGASRGVSIQWRSGYILNHWESIGETWETDTWYNILVCFNCVADNYTLYIDDIYIGEYEFSSVVDAIDKIKFRTMYATNDEVYIDDIDYSWVAPYACNNTEPDNFPILEFEIDFCIDDLDYICYCLYWAFNTSSTYNVTFEWYNFDTNCWETITYGMFNDSIVCNSNCTSFDYIALDPYLNGTCLKFRFYVYDYFSEFYFYLDQFRLTIWSYIHATSIRSFCWRGIWEYRWNLESFGVNYTTDWIQFEVIPNGECCNFEAISESTHTTIWRLSMPDYDYIIFNDTLNDTGVDEYWDLYGVPERVIHLNYTASDDSYVPDWGSADANYGSDLSVQVGGGPGVSEVYTFIKKEFCYLYANYTQNSSVYLRHYIPSPGSVVPPPPSFIYVNSTSDFYEDTITWNNQPDGIEFFEATSWAEYYWTDDYIIDLGEPYYYYKLWANDGWESMWSRENYSDYIYHHLSKNYYGGGYMYMQTNITETLSLRSPLYDSFSLSVGDYFSIDLRTNTNNEINLILFKDDVTVKTFPVILEGNDNFEDQTVEILINLGIEFDRLMFTGILDPCEYFMVYNVSVMGNELSKHFYIDPDGRKCVVYDPGDYILRIYELLHGTFIFKDVRNVTLPIPPTDNPLVEYYVPIVPIQCRLTFYSQEGDYLNFDLFRVNITRIKDGVEDSYWLIENMFEADEETEVIFVVYDRFENLITNVTMDVDPFMDIELTVYTLKIHHQGNLQSNFSVQCEDSPIILYELTFPDEFFIYELITNNYTVNWTNGENNVTTSYNITLSSDYILILPTTWYNIYFAIFNYDGLGLNRDLVRFYINNERKDFGFNTLKYDTVNLMILDFFNTTLFDQDVYMRDFTEYNIPVEVYELIVINNYTHAVIIEIERSGTEIKLKQVIPAQTGIPYRFLPEIEYSIKCYYTNETFIEEKSVNLEDDPTIVAFGWYSAEIPSVPLSVFDWLKNWFWIIIFFILFILILIAIIWYLWAKMKRIPPEYEFVTKKKKKKTKGWDFTNE